MDKSRLAEIIISAIIIGCVIVMWIIVPALTLHQLFGLNFVNGVTGGVALNYAVRMFKK